MRQMKQYKIFLNWMAVDFKKISGIIQKPLGGGLMRDVYTVSNVGKFVDDHPEIQEFQSDTFLKDILDKTNQLSDARGVLSGIAVREILGRHAELFFKEVENDPVHIRLALMVLKAANQELFKK